MNLKRLFFWAFIFSVLLGYVLLSEKMPVEKFVLAPFTKTEKYIVEDRIDAIEHGVELFVRGDVAAAMNLINGIK